MRDKVIIPKEEKEMSPSQLIANLSRSFIIYTKQGIISHHPSVFIHGQPGIGKSQAVRQIASIVQEATNKQVYVTDVRLLLFSPIDLRGIPIAVQQKKSAVWLKPEIFQMNDSEKVINILFLDELTSAPTSIQTAALQIALDRKIGEHELPRNTFVIAAGNRLEDHSVTFEMPTALRNRFIHFELKVDFDDWMIWAQANNLHPEILDFLRNNPDKFTSDNFDSCSNILVTPRSWEMLSTILKTLGGTLEENEPYVASTIGSSLAYIMIHQNPSICVEDVFYGKVDDCPKSMSELQRIVDILENLLPKHAHVQSHIENLLRFMSKIPTDYGIVLFRKLIRLDISEYDITVLDAYREFHRALEEVRIYE